MARITAKVSRPLGRKREDEKAPTADLLKNVRRKSHRLFQQRLRSFGDLASWPSSDATQCPQCLLSTQQYIMVEYSPPPSASSTSDSYLYPPMPPDVMQISLDMLDLTQGGLGGALSLVEPEDGAVPARRDEERQRQ